jgi:hypothetical protein
MQTLKELFWLAWDTIKSFWAWVWDLIGTEGKTKPAEILTAITILAVLYFGFLVLWAVLA